MCLFTPMYYSLLVNERYSLLFLYCMTFFMKKLEEMKPTIRVLERFNDETFVVALGSETEKDILL